MEAKWHDTGANKTEIFIDVNKIPIHKKIVRPICQQTDLESRKIWMEVTAGLKYCLLFYLVEDNFLQIHNFILD